MEELKEPYVAIKPKKTDAAIIQPKKPSSTVDESKLMDLAFKLSEDMNLGSFEMCYDALKAAQGDEQLAVEYLLN
jgi:hypothetical protein